MKKKVLTTGEVARLLGININTVIKWFDEGKIKGFRLPSSSDRRIPISSLKSFMAEHSIPMDLLEEDAPMRRMHERIPCAANVKLFLSNGKDLGSYEASLRNLSLGGACVSLSGEQGFSIPLHECDIRMLMLDGPCVGSDLSGKIVRLTPEKEEVSLGLQFNADQAGLGDVRKFLEKQA